MKIYTKTGDEGKTSLFGGKRVEKNHIRLEAYGTIDELNSVLGVSSSFNNDELVKKTINDIQNSLFRVGSELATPEEVKSKAIVSISPEEINNIEKVIDDIELKLNPLKNFILPGGSKLAAFLHLARTVCRRAERKIIELDLNESINPDILVYINRLSDLLFVLARFANHLSSTPEIEWKQRG
jgi:cob(I)alamin adenosyltransferase